MRDTVTKKPAQYVPVMFDVINGDQSLLTLNDMTASDTSTDDKGKVTITGTAHGKPNAAGSVVEVEAKVNDEVNGKPPCAVTVKP